MEREELDYEDEEPLNVSMRSRSSSPNEARQSLWRRTPSPRRDVKAAKRKEIVAFAQGAHDASFLLFTAKRLPRAFRPCFHNYGYVATYSTNLDNVEIVAFSDEGIIIQLLVEKSYSIKKIKYKVVDEEMEDGEIEDNSLRGRIGVDGNEQTLFVEELPSKPFSIVNDSIFIDSSRIKIPDGNFRALIMKDDFNEEDILFVRYMTRDETRRYAIPGARKRNFQLVEPPKIEEEYRSSRYEHDDRCDDLSSPRNEAEGSSEIAAPEFLKKAVVRKGRGRIGGMASSSLGPTVKRVKSDIDDRWQHDHFCDDHL